jgi:hypothetical protein
MLQDGRGAYGRPGSYLVIFDTAHRGPAASAAIQDVSRCWWRYMGLEDGYSMLLCRLDHKPRSEATAGGRTAREGLCGSRIASLARGIPSYCTPSDSSSRMKGRLCALLSPGTPEGGSDETRDRQATPRGAASAVGSGPATPMWHVSSEPQMNEDSQGQFSLSG